MAVGIKVVIKGVSKTLKGIEKDQEKAIKAHQIAVKKEAFTLRKQLKEELSEGQIAGRELPKLRHITKRAKRSWRNIKPLSRMSKSVRYLVEKHNDDLAVTVGWTKNLSPAWRKIAHKQQEGATINLSGHLRKFFMELGNKVPDRDERKELFYFKEKKNKLKIPSRPVIGPYWEKNKAQARLNIKKNFKRKMKGHRI